MKWVVITALMLAACSLAVIAPAEQPSFMFTESLKSKITRAAVAAETHIRSTPTCLAEFEKFSEFPRFHVPVTLSPSRHPANPAWGAWTTRNAETGEVTVVVLEFTAATYPDIDLRNVLIHEYAHANDPDLGRDEAEPSARRVERICTQ